MELLRPAAREAQLGVFGLLEAFGGMEATGR